MEYRTVSADDHIDLQWLPKDLWQKRVPAEWRERAPKVVDTPEGPNRPITSGCACSMSWGQIG